MTLLASADGWEKHQRREIALFLRAHASEPAKSQAQSAHPEYLPLYPGSMLFNQIGVLYPAAVNVVAGPDVPGPDLPGSDVPGPDVEAWQTPLFESLDTVYAALAPAQSANMDGGDTLLIDCQCWWPGLEAVLQIEIDKVSVSLSERFKVVVLAGRYAQRVQSICNNMSIVNSVTRPDWRNAAALISLYRKSAHTLFVDSARSLDAAMIGCKCCLVAGEAYSATPVFPALRNALSQVSTCQVVLPPRYNERQRPTKISMVENSRCELLLAINRECKSAGVGKSIGTSAVNSTGDSTGDSTESGARVGREAGPVVRTDASMQRVLKRRLDNFNISVRRKTRKLIEDPRAFFSDSSIPCSSAIASILPDTTRLADIKKGSSSQ